MSDVTSRPTVTLVREGAQAPQVVALREGETVLEGLLRAGVPVPHSCRAGACQSCMMQATAGTPPPEAQRGLKDGLRARGLFLACAAKPTRDLTVQFADGVAQRVSAVIRRVEMMSRDVARVWLSCDAPFAYFPGQFVNVARGNDLMRSYSLASLHSPPGMPPGDALLELHVRKVTGGRMSHWLHDAACAGDAVELTGPLGDCFYVAGKPQQPILLVGTGTGLAPLYAIARDALRHAHIGPVALYHGALEAGGLYLVDELRRLAAVHPNFSYTPCVLRGQSGGAERVGAIDQIVLGDHPNLAGWRVFLCGDPTLVNMLRKKVYLAGASMKDINADAFVMRTPAAQPSAEGADPKPAALVANAQE